ncbi:hypothetical protein BJN34_32025 [Cupriavidus necator]|uniref:HTH luxR-type domain-containing protein n=1 Tax=Cupriavidus necator TaxID=106590 RepID=A0A1U9V294_CUPNE|nr:LuxR C-terminal-related transcriptional regulator [Cupriavidus necator]AQV98505.1 hypothetical protein BJN34_32025 [Cupriavidus necator]
MHSPRFSRAIESLYHLSDTSPPWEAILEGARELVGADSGSLIAFDGESRLLNLTYAGSATEWSREYGQHFHSLDPLEHNSRSAPAGTWVDTVHLYSAAAMQRTEFFADFMAKYDMAQILVLVIEASPSIRAAVGFQRSSVDGRLMAKVQEGERGEYFRLLRKQLSLRQDRLAQGIMTMESAFAAFDEALLLVRPDGNVVHASRFAARHLDGRSGLTIHRGIFGHRDAKAHSLIASRLQACAHRGRRHTVSVAMGTPAATTVDIALAASTRDLVGSPLLIVRLHSPSQQALPDVEQLTASLPITAAEAAVLEALLYSQKVTDIAAGRGVSVHTVRTQVAALMRKLDCTRQADLVSIALALPSPTNT